MIEVDFIKSNILDVLDDATVKSSLELAVRGVAEAKSAAPKDTARLVNSIMYRTLNKTGGLNDKGGDSAPFEVTARPKNDKEAIVGFNLNYGIYQEFGTRNVPPRPFLRVSMAILKGQNGLDVIKKIQEQDLKTRLKKGTKQEKII